MSKSKEKPLDTITFRAILADVQSPVKPTKDFNPKTHERRTRVTLDAYMEPGAGEMLLLLGDDHTVQVTVKQIPKPAVKPSLY